MCVPKFECVVYVQCRMRPLSHTHALFCCQNNYNGNDGSALNFVGWIYGTGRCRVGQIGRTFVLLRVLELERVIMHRFLILMQCLNVLHYNGDYGSLLIFVG